MKEIITLLESKLKIEILRLLDKPMTPVMIAKLLKRPRPSISRAVIQLKEQTLLKCLNPKSDKWRQYEITTKGKNILKKISKFC